MADLSTLDASGSVKIAGADSSGLETNFVNATSLGELKTSDIITGAGAEGALTVGTSAVEAKVGASALTNRKLLTIFNNSGSTIYWGRTTSVTTSIGTPVYEKQFFTFDFSSDAPVYLIAGSAGNNVRITESV
jgi:hypothetical protein